MLASLLACLAFFSASGANCTQFLAQWPQPPQPLPQALPPEPTLDDVVRAVNQNSDRVQTLSTRQATLDMAGAPALQTSIDVVRPRRIRLRGSFLGSDELDLGSNDREFWLWVRRNDPPALVYCAHEDFHASPAKRLLPIEPEWLIDALGVVWLDPQAPHQGPTHIGNGRLELRTPLETAEGSMTKLLILDGASAAILEQQVYDSQGKLLASAVAREHHIDPRTGALLPGRVEISFNGVGGAPPLSMVILLKNLQVNTLGPGAEGLWQRPAIRGYPAIDLADLNSFASQPARHAQ